MKNRDTRRLARHAEALRRRLLRRWLARWLKSALRRIGTTIATLRAEAELRALDAHELHDLGLDHSGITYAARHGRENQSPDNLFTGSTSHTCTRNAT